MTCSSQYSSLPEQYALNLCTIAGQPLELCKSALGVWGGGGLGSYAGFSLPRISLNRQCLQDISFHEEISVLSTALTTHVDFDSSSV